MDNRIFPQWLQDAIVYQIYPQSFLDTNADGIGDLPGVTKKLDYLKSLGVSVLWLNPIFDSPFRDAGYDVRDFFKVAQRYGTEEDLVELFEQARRREMRVILDLVAGHTSNEHQLFLESATSPDSAAASRFIWKNRDFDRVEGPDVCHYAKNFFDFQPALNFGYANPKEEWQDPVDAPGPRRNREYLKKIMAYWMDRGASGFRVDMASSLVKDDPGHLETIRLWKELRAWWESAYPDGILVAEWSHPKEAVEAGFHLDFMMHFNVAVYRSLFFNEAGTLPYLEGDCYFDSKGAGSARHFMSVYTEHLAATSGKGFISLPSANHDFQRLHCGSRGWEGLRPAWVFLMTQAGPPTIYYGDEIGMRYVPETLPTEGSTLQGVTAPNAGAIQGERAGTRTPMQWERSGNAGFSEASPDKLYLPLDPDPDRPVVDEQESDPGSLLNFIRMLIRLRNANPALGTRAEYQFINPAGVDYPLVIARTCGQQKCIVVVNPADKKMACVIQSDGQSAIELIGIGCELHWRDGLYEISTDPFAYGIFELKNPE